MKRAFNKEVIRSITGSWGRFLAIAGIVALGCGFYAGLRMTGADMRIAADKFYDGTQLYDIRLLSTLGFSDNLVTEIANIDGVEAVMPSYSTDVMATIGAAESQYTIRVSSLDVNAAEESTTSDGYDVASTDESYLNRLVLDEGSWPTEEGQCVLSADSVTDTPVQIGDTVQVLYGSQDLDGVLEERTYTVVGLVHSSSYVSSSSLGSTSLGSGTIQQYMYVSSDNFSADCPYTEIFIKVAGASSELAGSDAYQDTVDQVTSRIQGSSADIAATRLSEIKASAQSKLDDSYAEYESEKTTAYAQLDDAAAQLEAAATTLTSSQQQIDEGQAEYDSGASELETSRESATTQFSAAYDQLTATQSQLDDASTQIEAGQAQLDTALQQWQQSWAYLQTLDPSSQEYQQLEAQLTVAKTTLDTQQAALDTQKATLESGRTQLAAGWTSYLAEKDDAEQQLASSQTQLDAAAESLATARTQLAAGQQEYDTNLATYESSRDEADQKFADAATTLSDAQAEVDDTAAPTIYVLDRTKNYGVASFSSDAERVDNIAAVFPLIFFLVAALVALTTMTRMVEEERVLIGTYKALGYGTARITSKYLIYAGIASITGSAVGILALSQVLPTIISKAYAIMYNTPQQSLPLTIDVPIALLSAGLGVGITLLATWGAVAATLREEPATLMLPRTPKAGKRILLERIAPLWRRLSFSWKITFRNLFRYKKRLWMTVIGIAGCTALLLTGLGLHDAIWDIIDIQFNDIVSYNIIVGLDDNTTNSDATAVTTFMEDSGEATACTRVQRENMQIDSDTHSTMGVQVVVPQDASAMTDLVTMRVRTTGEAVSFDDDSVILSEKLARTLGVSVGDTFTLYSQDEIGNATGDGYRFTVTGIMENYVGNYAYIGKDAYAQAIGNTPGFTSIYGISTTDTDQRTALTESLHDMSTVDTVTYNDETISAYRKALSSVNMIVVVLVTAAAALAFIVLYNLTNINITERRREIASLKVLGFTPREVDAYIYREIILLTVLGAAFGLVLGVFMENFVVVTAEIDQVMFGRTIHVTSFLIAFALTMAFSLFVMLVMRKKLDDIDMVESLKSIE